MNKVPPTIQAIEASCCVTVPNEKKNKIYSSWIWVLTFLTYTSYHMSRKPLSVVKNVLTQNCSNMTPPEETNNTHWCDWAPFDTDDAEFLLGKVDSAFLFTYAAAMFLSGYVAERVDLRLFLSFGMIMSGCFCAMFGLGYSFQMHNIWYYYLAQVLNGFMQATGWPGVVTALGNWFGKSKRGLIFGLWNIHTSLGNIVGTLIAAAFVSYNWALSFVVPGIIIASLGIIVFFFLVPEPSYIGLPNPNTKKVHERTSPTPQRRYRPDYEPGTQEESASLLDDEVQVSYVDKDKEEDARSRSEHEENDKAIGFLQALLIPGVVEFALCLFFAKLVSYTFLYWLPNYIYNNTSFGAEGSANLSALFDVGAMIGSVMAGLISDYSGMPATTCTVMLIFAIPMMEVYRLYASISRGMTAGLLVLMGSIVNGPYSLITTAISADLGNHPSLAGSARAVATVTAIIDGTGSIGVNTSLPRILREMLMTTPYVFNMYIYQAFSTISVGMNTFLLILVGLMVNGPYSLITTAVSADLGTHESLRGNAKALATVSSVIDGTGSIGAAVGPLIAGFLTSIDANFFIMLMVSDIIAVLMLIRLVVREVRKRIQQHRQRSHSRL